VPDSAVRTDDRSVSVVVPCFNTGRLILDALASVTDQEGPFSLHEILVVDDGSTDAATCDVLGELQAAPQVSVLRNTRRKGPAGARNTGAFAATGRWLAFLDADDLWLPGSLSARFAALDVFPDARVVSGDFQIWDAGSGQIEENFFASRERPARFFGPAYQSGRPVRLQRPFRETLATALCHSCSIIVTRELFAAVNGFEESLMYKEDHHLWFKLARHSDLVLVPQSVFLYRQHVGNMTRRECTPFEYEKAMLDFVCRSEDLTGVHEDIDKRYASGFAQDARWFRSRRDFRAALRSCLAGLRRAPVEPQLWKQLAASLARIE